MQEAFVNIDSIPTKVLSYGRWITEKPNSSENKIILLITGNPGIPGFYKSFMHNLHKKHNCPVWAIGYGGHEIERKKSCPELIGLKEQIKLKVSFIQQYVPENAELHVIGHSIGAYMTLELLKEPGIEKRIVQTYLLFPTIEDMKITPNGHFLYTYVRPILSIILFFSWLFRILPRFISVNLLIAYMWIANIPTIHRTTILGLIHPKVLQQVFSLAYQELDQVKMRDDENIASNLHRINILYGAEDKWCFPAFYEDIKKKFPSLRVRITQCDHSFVFHDNEAVADIVSKFMWGSSDEDLSC